MKESVYLTTPIYYVNDVPHVGHAYCTIATDILARYHRLYGRNVLFSTGTDEHGQKIQKTAEANGETPMQLADRVVIRFEKLWERLNITNDVFIRTTEARHKEAVQKLFGIIYEKGDIYLGEYEGWYCRPCEAYFTETQLEEGKCPQCKRAVELLKEESFFFRMSRYQEQLLAHIESHPDFIFPATRRNEVINFVKEGLRDISISRTTVSWGIPVPDLPGMELKNKHYIYVWFDALINYLTAAGYLEQGQGSFETFWGNAIHVIGKDILKFHAVIWPTMLMAAGLPLPRQIVAHGFITMQGEKMSKSLGNVIDPYQVVDEYGVDPLRYYLMREISFGHDGVFSYESLEQRYNAELANELGNLLNRTIPMVRKYFNGMVPAFRDSFLSENGKELRAWTEQLRVALDPLVNSFNFNGIFEEIWKVIRRANRFIEESAPWTLSKEGKTEELAGVMYSLLETIRIAALYVHPFIPDSAQKIWDQLNIDQQIADVTVQEKGAWGMLREGHRIGEAIPIFPRR